MKALTRILVVHQSGSLYGSDRSLLDWLEQANDDGFEPIVCMPESGPLLEVLRRTGIEVHVIPVFKINRASLYSVRFLLSSPINLIHALLAIHRVVHGRAVSIVYSNTIVVYGGAAWACINGLPHVWHIRETAYKPAIVVTAIRKLVALFSERAICNSRFTQSWLLEACKVSSAVVWNGVPAITAEQLERRHRTLARSKLEVEADECLIVLPGRLSPSKGQDLLISAMNALPSDSPKFQLLLVGDEVDGQSSFRAHLLDLARDGSFSDRIRFLGFVADMDPIYLSAGIVVVPSRHPESFGRVAIEAMAYGRPVIAAAHGGVTEIIDHGVSGILVKPSSASELTDALRKAINDPEWREHLGKAALRQQRDRFSIQSYRTGVSSQLREALSRYSRKA